MDLEITEQNNTTLQIHNSANNLDKELAPDIPEPLPSSTFCMVICGPSGSGKSTSLYSIMTKRKKNKVSLIGKFLIKYTSYHQRWLQQV